MLSDDHYYADADRCVRQYGRAAHLWQNHNLFTPSQLAPWSDSSNRSYRTLANSFPGTFVPWNFCFLDHLLPGTFAPGEWMFLTCLLCIFYCLYNRTI